MIEATIIEQPNIRSRGRPREAKLVEPVVKRPRGRPSVETATKTTKIIQGSGET